MLEILSDVDIIIKVIQDHDSCQDWFYGGMGRKGSLFLNLPKDQTLAIMTGLKL